jgi:hypothetical protein
MNNNALTRKEVYEILDTERAYQDEKWGAAHDAQHTVGDFLVFMDTYLKMAKTEYTRVNGDTAALEVLRKVTALGVACMEINGAQPRQS